MRMLPTYPQGRIFVFSTNSIKKSNSLRDEKSTNGGLLVNAFLNLWQPHFDSVRFALSKLKSISAKIVHHAKTLAHAIYCQTHCQHIILQNHHNLVQTNANSLPNGRGGQLKHVANPDLQTSANCPPDARGGQLEHAHFKSKAFLKSKSLHQSCICQTPGCGDTGHPQPTNKCMEFDMGRRVPRTN